MNTHLKIRATVNYVLYGFHCPKEVEFLLNQSNLHSPPTLCKHRVTKALFDKLGQLKSYEHYLKKSFLFTRETSIFEEQIIDWNAIEIQTQY